MCNTVGNYRNDKERAVTMKTMTMTTTMTAKRVGVAGGEVKGEGKIDGDDVEIAIIVTMRAKKTMTTAVIDHARYVSYLLCKYFDLMS